MGKKKQPVFHIKNGYKRFQSKNGYKFWARDKKDAEKYCNLMDWVLGELIDNE